MTDLIWSFAPWLVFLAAERVTSLYGAVAAAAAAAVVVLITAIRRKRVHMLDMASTVYFAALGATLIAVHPGHLEYWSRYAQAGSHIALTLLVFGSILIGRPFTESYARQTTPEPVWRTRRFHSLNRQISAVWGLAFIVGTASLIAAGSVDSRQVLLRIIVPFGTLYYAYAYTQKQTKKARQATTEQAGPES
jgi:Ca2+/Na+ antiporter